MAGMTYGNFPHSGPNPRTSTTPMNPHHVTEHNDYNTALNQIKSEYNTLVNKYIPWYCPNGINIGPAFGPSYSGAATDGKYDSLMVTGVVRVGSDTNDSQAGDEGTWTPLLTDFNNNSAVFNAEFRATWFCIAPTLFFINVELRVTGAWSNVTLPQFTLPAGWKQFTHENFVTGIMLNKGDPFGRHYPLIGIIHTMPLGSGGNIAGENNDTKTVGTNEPVVRLLSSYVIA